LPSSTDQQLTPQQQVAFGNRKKSFENDMVNHGIIEDIQEIGRFNYVLLSRSVDFDGYDET
jgi:hypothetical protein